jgi:hypothetical protein
MRGRCVWRTGALAACALALGALSGCAVFDEDNRVLLSRLDETVQPKSTAARIALGPVALVGGAGAAAIDAAVIHPVRVAPAAWDDVRDLYWKGGGEEDALRKTLFLVPKAVLTPLTLAVDWAGRAAFGDAD